jgi:2-keto-4-pentenoate hydratase/2-oxohepta-3-ene-1,7-dioic acid hydratase in catechol pathway|tara:strand:- start:122 stop:991 length:870 start_codon:yes stop_codon:yes gene_type:complete
VTFTADSETRIGLLKEEGIIDLSQVAPSLPKDMLSFLEGGEDTMNSAAKAAASDTHFSINAVRLECPVPRPPKIVAIGLNYRAHAEETGAEIPVTPVVFTKQSTCACGPLDDVFRPPESDLLDYEGELAIIIGRRCRRVTRDKAPDVIAGYCIMNDVSVRDWQMRGQPMSFTMGKSWDTHGPFGPSLVTADEVGDPNNLQLKTWVNGDLRQDTNTNDLIFDCFELVEFLSTAFTLEPGDVITTGTPSGVAAAMQPPAWLVPGDVIRVEIEKLGYIENRIIQESAEEMIS